jgi:hypothetical protein
MMYFPALLSGKYCRFIKRLKSDFKSLYKAEIITDFLVKYFTLTANFLLDQGSAKVKNIPDPRKFPIFAG